MDERNNKPMTAGGGVKVYSPTFHTIFQQLMKTGVL